LWELFRPSANADDCRFVFTFAILHLMVFIFGMMNYGFTVRLSCARCRY